MQCGMWSDVSYSRPTLAGIVLLRQTARMLNPVVLIPRA